MEWRRLELINGTTLVDLYSAVMS